MILPNASLAIIDPGKIRDYCLNIEHPRGKHKAKIFQEVLGITKNDTQALILQIKRQIRSSDCIVGEADTYGQRYTVDIIIRKHSLEAMIRTAWIIKTKENIPRLTTCYVL